MQLDFRGPAMCWMLKLCFPSNACLFTPLSMDSKRGILYPFGILRHHHTHVTSWKWKGPAACLHLWSGWIDEESVDGYTRRGLGWQDRNYEIRRSQHTVSSSTTWSFPLDGEGQAFLNHLHCLHQQIFELLSFQVHIKIYSKGPSDALQWWRGHIFHTELTISIIWLYIFLSELGVGVLSLTCNLCFPAGI